MTIELSKEVREQAIVSIQRVMETETGKRMGNIAASALLGFILREVAPWP